MFQNVSICVKEDAVLRYLKKEEFQSHDDLFKDLPKCMHVFLKRLQVHVIYYSQSDANDAI